MKNILYNDRWLRIISVLIAIVIWLYIVVFIDPVVEFNTGELPVQFVGTEVLEERGLGIVSESVTSIDVKIRGSRKRIGRNAMKNVIAKADVSGIKEEGTITVPIDVIIPFENSGISSQSYYSVDVKAEKLTDNTLKIDIYPVGELAPGYMVGPIVTSHETVSIRGPESVVGKITKAGVILNYNNADVDISTKLPVRFYGTDGKEIATVDTILTRIDQDVDQVDVRCTVVKLREVPVEVDIINNYSGEMLECLVNPKTVQIYGDDTITSKIMSISTEPVSAEKLKGSDKVKVKLDIPDDVKILLEIEEVEVSLVKSGKN